MQILAVLFEIHNPRFTTEEMESSKLKCLFKFKITQLFYDDGKKDYPSHAFGYVFHPNGKRIRAVWDRHGQCLVEQVRILDYDLVRHTQSEIDSYRAIGETALLTLIGLLICIIF